MLSVQTTGFWCSFAITCHVLFGQMANKLLVSVILSLKFSYFILLVNFIFKKINKMVAYGVLVLIEEGFI